MHADHITGFAELLNKYNIKSVDDAVECEAFWDLENGRTLCVPCHRGTSNYGVH